MHQNSENIYSKLKNKYRNIRSHIKYKGLGFFLAAKLYDRFYQFKFKQKGISHGFGKNELEETISHSVNKDAHENQPSSFYALREGFRQTKLAFHDISLIDIGCGDGRVMNYGMQMNFKKVIGIDLNRTALLKAEANCLKMQQQGSKTQYLVEYADAVHFSIPADVNLIYLFNPFGKKTMEEFVHNLIGHVQRCGHDVYVFYCIPSFKEEFEAAPGSTKIFESLNDEGSHVYMSIFRMH